MALRVYNSLTNRKEPFLPLEENRVRMYACGVTVYDRCHIGHGMQAIVYDTIRRYLRFLGYEVLYVRNHTDVDDKILDRAAQLGVDPLEHARRMIALTEEDMAALGVEPADVEPKVTDHIPDIIALIERLVEKGFAYPSGGSVYFSVRKFPEYGKLSNRKIEELEVGARIEIDAAKADPLDFALWKGAKPGELSWPSPWGPGRPGWHIECSALSMRYLGETFDIHGGGR
ncbi:MAG: cysteine--tRNA ligase, partial [Deltaproteobacteria bacterium]